MDPVSKHTRCHCHKGQQPAGSYLFLWQLTLVPLSLWSSSAIGIVERLAWYSTLLRPQLNRMSMLNWGLPCRAQELCFFFYLCPRARCLPLQNTIREFSVGNLVKDKLTRPISLKKSSPFQTTTPMMISFFVTVQTNCRAFSYCFPSDHENEGFLSTEPYIRDEKLML
jgi:hypothetical protein